jgi:hypothetical protein
MDEPQDFEAFWKKFLGDHPSAWNRWAHVAALGAGAGGVALAVARRSAWPLLIGGGVAATLAVGGHPLFQGDLPKNFGRPLWGARAFVRLCLRTVSGEAARELAAMAAEEREELAAEER